MNMKSLSMVAYWLVIVGALNWGLTVFGMNLVDMLLGMGSTLAKVVYLLVGVSGLWLALDATSGKKGKK